MKTLGGSTVFLEDFLNQTNRPVVRIGGIRSCIFERKH